MRRGDIGACLYSQAIMNIPTEMSISVQVKLVLILLAHKILENFSKSSRY